MDTATLELGTLDYVIFFGALIGAMAVGMWAGRKEDTSEDYFLAGKGLRWFGVAGSIFGSNVSANHMVGMMGVGFSIGFAQSHFEIGAIFGLLLLCFGFLPVYRKLNLYTLSEYLGKRYDDRSRISYALIMIIIMAGVQMIPALYIGSRTICELMGGDAIVSEAGSPEVAETSLTAAVEGTVGAQLKAKPSMKLVSMPHYTTFVIALGLIAGSYTILGGLKAVVYTDIIQSVLMLIVGIGIAILVFSQFSWGEMVAANDTAVAGGAVARLTEVVIRQVSHDAVPRRCLHLRRRRARRACRGTWREACRRGPTGTRTRAPPASSRRGCPRAPASGAGTTTAAGRASSAPRAS